MCSSLPLFPSAVKRFTDLQARDRRAIAGGTSVQSKRCSG